MAQQIQLRNDSTAAWEAENPILAQGEFGVDTTLGQFKIGDGTSTWSQLEFHAGGTANIADFVFDFVDNDGDTNESRITIANHDMVIRTTRTETQDADITIESADDLWLTALNDDIRLRAGDDVVIITNTEGDDEHNWEFTNGGVLQKDGTLTLNANDNDGNAKSKLELDPFNGISRLKAYGNDNTATFITGDWDTATWTESTAGSSDLTLTNASSIISFMENTGYQVDVLKISVNDGIYGIYNGASSGDGAITFNISGIAPEGVVTVTEVRFQYAFSSKVDIDYDEGDLSIITQDEMNIKLEADGNIDINAADEDINLRANDDIKFYTNWQYGGIEPEWRMTNTGRFELPADGYIENPQNASSDGNGNNTMHLVPDSGLIEENGNQYLIIEPTQAPNPEAPGHIHIRAGGTIDESTADLVLGGERNNVIVSDSERGVAITARPPRIVNSYANESVMSGTDFVTSSSSDIQVGYTVNIDGTDYLVDGVMPIDEGVVAVTASGAVFAAESNYTFTFEPDYDNQWIFNADGLLIGPAMGAVRVYAINNATSGVDLGVYSNDAKLYLQATDNVEVNSYNGNIFLNPDGGVFLGTTTDVESQMAVQADLAYRRSGIVPTTSIGSPGDIIHQVVDDGTHHYYCTANYDGTTHIWKRIAWSNDTWGV